MEGEPLTGREPDLPDPGACVLQQQACPDERVRGVRLELRAQFRRPVGDALVVRFRAGVIAIADGCYVAASDSTMSNTRAFR